MTRPIARTPLDTLFGRSLPPISAAMPGVVRVILGWQDRHRTRCALSRLDAHLIRDIGLTRDAVLDETVKPFWRG